MSPEYLRALICIQEISGTTSGCSLCTPNNAGCQWYQEHRMGSIEFGKIANMTVFDCDFLHDSLDKVAKANVIATIVDGEEVYKA